MRVSFAPRVRFQPPKALRTAARRLSFTRHHTQRPRFSPRSSPASANTLVWWEMVGWLLAKGSSRLHEQISRSEATSESSRRRTGSARAAKTRASSAASSSLRGARVTGTQHKAPPTASLVLAARVMAPPTKIDSDQSLSILAFTLVNGPGDVVARAQLACGASVASSHVGAARSGARREGEDWLGSAGEPAGDGGQRDARCTAGQQAPVVSRLSLIDRALPLWVLLAMGLGLGLGRAVPHLSHLLSAMQVTSGTSLPIFVGLLVMMYPVLAKVRYGHLKSFR